MNTLTVRVIYVQDTHKMENSATAVELFSGCGGMTLGLKLAGFRVIGAVEIDPLSIETYRVNHPEVLVWASDICNVSTNEIMECLELRPGQLDLLAGCPPCQGFSSIRTLNGAKSAEDSRNDLVFEFLRFVKALQPKAVMMENTPGLAKDWRMVEFFQELLTLGYEGDYPIVNAVNYGVPQRRRRMILLAGRFGPIGFPPPDPNRNTVRSAIASLARAGESGDALHDLSERHSKRVVDMIRKIPKNGGSRTDLGEEHQLACHQKCDGFKDVYGRMAWDREAPTITSGCFNQSKGRFLHPEEDRAITLREASLLQGFPPTYFFSLRKGKGAAAALIGNALPPEFVRHHAVSVKQYIESVVEVQ